MSTKNRIVIVEGVRTAIGRYGGVLKEAGSAYLASHVISEVLQRSGVEASAVEEVILGEVRQTSQSSNVARVAALRAGISESAPAFTVNRLCASGMQAIASGIQQIQSEQAKVVIAGGTESMSNAPIFIRGSRFGGDKTHLVDSNSENGQQPQEIYGDHLGMGVTAENVAERFNVTREDQDQFSYDSQQKTDRAIKSGAFKSEIAPYVAKSKKSEITVDTDEHPRPETTLVKLSTLKPVFKKGGSVTAGNACGRNDGAAAVLLMKEEEAASRNLSPHAAIVDWTSVGVSPEIMGIGPVPAIKKLLERTGVTLDEIDLFEVNEAFASQALAVQRELGIDADKLNINGGAIALGHPLGATGARIVVTLMHALSKKGGKYGIASLCVGGGQGMAILIENLRHEEGA
ncbi:thiolase family protein [Cytobacillus purgationiresistens]|uniref:acetyl-CoA C-acetyltransferase n=1 Tax=Cytobacillus purgationiresistens TaxID=863449 RepID=A0ABU0AHY5_9BACI|nr:thiolase family protein [Cytobacillus purgationiresistens]MDQ0270412.1 acetyl-CoA C-acetyltransferase [Cytobacillus purgationiresistens]